jgi:histidine triad (HIT) family protein
MSSCIFCQIVNGEISSIKIYEDEKTMAFLDVSPVNYGHTLVIPKEHYVNMEGVPEEELYAIITTVKKIGAAIKDGLNAPGYNIQENNDPVAGQVIPHLHFHIIPRVQNDGLRLWPQGRYGDSEAEEIAARIKKSLL